MFIEKRRESGLATSSIVGSHTEQVSTYGGLRQLNLSMAALHLVQGLIILWLGNWDFMLPINVAYLDFKESAQSLVPAARTLFDVRLVWLVAAFLFMSATAHWVIATIWRHGYERDLARGLNRARWFEYALSAATMMVAIALLVGVYDLASLLMIFALVAVMNLLGLVMEIHNQTTSHTRWISFVVGCLAGIVPWIVVALYFWAANGYGGGQIPAFVYGIYVSIFLFFNCFAVNMWLQYRKVGAWHSYLYGERAYIILSLVAKSALAWQVFAGTLRP
jgi:heliorhodopsin